MDTEKVYTPQVIADTPFPMQDAQSQTVTQPAANGIYKPQETTDNVFPVKRVAVELMSQALNTRSKKITQAFQFTQSGALQIGEYTNGVTGDVRISPNGITARNLTGDTTFDLDGETGDAVFAGQLRAGSTIVSNNIITEESSNGNGRTVYLNDGIPSIVIGDPS